MGGFGSAVLEAFHAEGLDASGLRVHGIPDLFVEHGPQAHQRAIFKLDAAGVVEKLLSCTRIWPLAPVSAADRRATRRSRRP